MCTLVTSRLHYANALYSSINTTDLAKVQRIENHAARIITRTRRSNHTHLCWFPIDKRIQYKILLYFYKVIHKMARTILLGGYVIKVYQPTRSLRSENSMALVRPRCRTSEQTLGCCGSDTLELVTC